MPQAALQKASLRRRGTVCVQRGSSDLLRPLRTSASTGISRQKAPFNPSWQLAYTVNDRYRSRLCENAGARFFCRSKVGVAASTEPFRLAAKSETREFVVWR